MDVVPNRMGKITFKEKVLNCLTFCRKSNTFCFLANCVWRNYLLLEWLLCEDTKEKKLPLVEPFNFQVILFKLGTSRQIKAAKCDLTQN